MTADHTPMPRAEHLLRAPVARCGWCNAATHIYWAMTATGKRMPIDAEPDPAGNCQLIWNGGRAPIHVTVHQGPPGMFDDWTAHMPHHATCARDSPKARAREEMATLKKLARQP